MSYRAPVKDIQFALEHVGRIGDLAQLDVFAHAEPAMVEGLLSEAGRFCNEVIAPTNDDGDAQGSVIRDGDDGVTVPDSFRTAYDQYVAAGWGALQFPEEFGGGGFPLTVATAFKEMLTSANMAFSLGPLLTTGAIVDLLVHGDDFLQQTFVPRMVSGEWTGTMNLSEPQAGSDVGALTTRAVPVADDEGPGTHRITGTKIWISHGDHDMTDNIVHLVLARLPDAPAGTRGISLFLVPKVLVDDDGELTERNGVEVVSTEHKLGIHGSPTCVMEYEDAVGWIVGEPNQGMRQMFTMMNDARLGVGVQGLSIAERAYQQAVQYANERRQGRAPGDDDVVDGQSLIVRHPDVRRMLLTMKSQIEAIRALTVRNAAAMDLAEHHDDEDVREAERKLADLLTPLSKAWGTDLGVEITSTAIQVYGGMGYVEETGVAQHFRDARIAPIYEGTNGIQAMDLVGRKLPYDGGAFVKGHLADMGELAGTLDDERFGAFGERLAAATEALVEATDWIFAHREDVRAAFGGATPYLRMYATVTAGALLAEGLQHAVAAGDVDEDYLADRFAVARFYGDNVLPTVHGLLGPATAGAESLYAIAEDRLASA